MKTIGNIIWIILGGFVAAVAWALIGLVLCITIIGIPFGRQCFKIASMQLSPFGKTVIDDTAGTGCSSLFGNIIWVIFCGWELALVNVCAGLIFAVSIIGIPFAIQSFKLAWLSLMPFGKKIISIDSVVYQNQ